MISHPGPDSRRGIQADDRAVLASALEGVTVERTMTERYPPTTSISVFDGAAAVTEPFVEIAQLRTTVSSEAILGLRGPRKWGIGHSSCVLGARRHARLGTGTYASSRVGV